MVDEAHNLVDRAREMFSADLVKEDTLSLKRQCKTKAKELVSILSKINSYFVKLRKRCEENDKYVAEKECPNELTALLIKYTNKAEKWLLQNKKAEEVLKGNKITDDLLAKAGQAAMEEADPTDSVEASAEYKKELVGILVKRVGKEALERASKA